MDTYIFMIQMCISVRLVHAHLLLQNVHVGYVGRFAWQTQLHLTPALTWIKFLEVFPVNVVRNAARLIS